METDVNGGHSLPGVDKDGSLDFNRKDREGMLRRARKDNLLGDAKASESAAAILNRHKLEEDSSNDPVEDDIMALELTPLRQRRLPAAATLPGPEAMEDHQLDKVTLSVGHEATLRKDRLDDSDDDDVDVVKQAPESEFQPNPKVHAFVGFLRLANFVSAAAAVFGVVATALLVDVPHVLRDPMEFWRQSVYVAVCVVQAAYLILVALVVMVDSVGTVTFRWKEYGELTHNHTDATSVLFLAVDSRWAWRLASGLLLASSASIGLMQDVLMPARLRDLTASRSGPTSGGSAHLPHLKHASFWFLGLTSACLASTLIGMLINVFPWHGVSWLYDSLMPHKIDDKGDVWKRSWTSGTEEAQEGSNRRHHPAKGPGGQTTMRALVRTVADILHMIIHPTGYLVSVGLALYAALITAKRGPPAGPPHQHHHDALVFEDVAILYCAACVASIGVGALLFLAFRLSSASCIKSSSSGAASSRNLRLPFAFRFFSTFCLTTAAKILLDIKGVQRDDPADVAGDGSEAAAAAAAERLETTKAVVLDIWLYFCCLSLLSTAMSLAASAWPWWRRASRVAAFVRRNFCGTGAGAGGDDEGSTAGVNKKAVRFFDTLGSVCALVGLVLGLCSLFVDQYDLSFSPEGTVKQVVDACHDFKASIEPVTVALKRIVDALDRKFTCEDVFNALGTGAAVALFASFFPGAGSVVNVGSKSAYYGVRAANALTNLAAKLRRSRNLVWQIMTAVYKVNKFAVTHLKKVVLASGSPSLAKLLPFLPPVVVGLYALFGCFWPRRILFFSAKQRRKTISGMVYTWVLALVALVAAVVINTSLVDELVRLLGENVAAVAKVELHRKLGWTLSMAGTGFAAAAATSYSVAYLILQVQTSKDHENITNEELDWKRELEARELVTIQTALGAKLEKRTQMKYKREAIGPWTWVVPILLVSVSILFGVAANLNPKLEMKREPKGPFGRLVDKVYQKISVYEDDMYSVGNDTESECLPYPTLDDVLREGGANNILVSPVRKFRAATQNLVRPLKDVVSGLRKQLVIDIDEELFGGNLDNLWRANHLQYVGMVFLVPRVLCLLILAFGCLMSSVFVCQMRIGCQSVEPRRIVEAFGKVALFSAIYVCAAQLSVFNLLSSFGVPLYRIEVRLGLGFVYDLVADAILISTYIGMKNEFFFTIPKRKTVVVYTVPGVSDEGPNIPGQIV